MLDDLGDLRDVDIEGIDDNLWVEIDQFEVSIWVERKIINLLFLVEVMKIHIQTQNVT